MGELLFPAYCSLITNDIMRGTNKITYLQVKYIKSNGYAGVMAWTIDLDDFNNKCCSESFPLLRAVNRAFGRLTDKKPTNPDCARPTISTPSPIGSTTTEDNGEICLNERT